MAERLERESCDCKTCVWSMGPGCWSVESYLLTPPLNQVKNASSSFLFSFFCMFPFLKDPWILEILTLTAQGRALLRNSPPHSLPTDLLRWRFCTSAVIFKDENKISKELHNISYCRCLHQYFPLGTGILLVVLMSSTIINNQPSIWSCWTAAFTTTSSNHLSTRCHGYVR